MSSSRLPMGSPPKLPSSITDNPATSHIPLVDQTSSYRGEIMNRINRVAILGAGTMGARIAAHFANAGVPSYLLDIVPPDVQPDAGAAERNKIAAAGLEAVKKSKPAAFMESSLARLITVGNFDDDLKKLAEVDWIVDAVAEKLDLKRALLRQIE